MPCGSAILLVDDEINLLRTLALILQRNGYTVYTAGGAREAMQTLKDTQVDLLFLDLKMPEINGLSLLPIIRRMYPGLPVVILTAYPCQDVEVEALNLGARDFLTKPLDPARILGCVRAILEDRQRLVSQV